MTLQDGYYLTRTVIEINMPVSSNKKSFSVTLPLETYELLRQWAKDKDWNVSQAARNLIVQGLEKAPLSQPKPEAKGKGDK